MGRDDATKENYAGVVIGGDGDAGDVLDLAGPGTGAGVLFVWGAGDSGQWVGMARSEVYGDGGESVRARQNRRWLQRRFLNISRRKSRMPLMPSYMRTMICTRPISAHGSSTRWDRGRNMKGLRILKGLIP